MGGAPGGNNNVVCRVDLKWKSTKCNLPEKLLIVLSVLATNMTSPNFTGREAFSFCWRGSMQINVLYHVCVFFFRTDLAALVSNFFDFTFATALQILTKLYMNKKQVFSSLTLNHYSASSTVGGIWFWIRDQHKMFSCHWMLINWHVFPDSLSEEKLIEGTRSRVGRGRGVGVGGGGGGGAE